ncbi:MAG TPA: anthranilate synthase component I [bacterium]
MRVLPTEAEFARLARRGTVVPVHAELLADLETPVSAFQKLDDGRYSYLLESVEGTEQVARYSFLGSRPRLIWTSTGRRIEISTLRDGGAPVTAGFDTAADPLTELERFMRGYRVVDRPGLPRFCGGLVGYVGYNAVQFLEPVPRHRTDALGVPDIMFMLADSMVVFDHARHKLLLVANALTQDGPPRRVWREAVSRLEFMAGRLRRRLPTVRRPSAGGRSRAGRTRSNMSRAEFERLVVKTKRYIRQGEIIQAVLSQRFDRELTCAPFDVYRVLRSVNPSPYMYYLRFGSVHLVGSSPEMLVRCEEGRLETRPIAGTRPRGATPREDERMTAKLRSSPKERAEHLMLVDLGRNDLGRVAKVGSVRTPELMAIERYSHVLHLVSSVTARLARGRNAFDVLRATFPAGTVTGAPKIRAMEIIAELEREDRGPYAGAVGYLGFSGNLDTCITIRTILVRGRRASVQAGAGIVADSRPAHEYRETLSKARGMLHAIDIAESRFGRASLAESGR